ncbi:hypothetical protein NPN18_27000, partial [Vibrio parahaemolyticus]|nr:hypothetical protein [Vibrio parahaemolyticus]
GLEIVHERKSVGIVNSDIINVDRQHLEAGLLKETADITNIRKRRHVGRDAAFPLLLGELK